MPAKWAWMKINGLQLFCQRFSGNNSALFICADIKKEDSGTYRYASHSRRKLLLSGKKNKQCSCFRGICQCTHKWWKLQDNFVPRTNLHLLFDANCSSSLSLIILDKCLLTLQPVPDYVLHVCVYYALSLKANQEHC